MPQVFRQVQLVVTWGRVQVPKVNTWRNWCMLWDSR